MRMSLRDRSLNSKLLTVDSITIKYAQRRVLSGFPWVKALIASAAKIRQSIFSGVNKAMNNVWKHNIHTVGKKLETSLITSYSMGCMLLKWSFHLKLFCIQRTNSYSTQAPRCCNNTWWDERRASLPRRSVSSQISAPIPPGILWDCCHEDPVNFLFTAPAPSSEVMGRNDNLFSGDL